MWIDTHCHLDAHEFGAASPEVARRAQDNGVGMIVIPAVERGNFEVVRALAGALPHLERGDAEFMRVEVAVGVDPHRRASG